MRKLKLKLKQEQKSELSSKQAIAIEALQKQKQNLVLKEYLVMAGFALGGAFLRVPMQIIPSAEPLTFFAILAGWFFGKKKGFMVGASSLFISNFLVIGGQGPWSYFQMLAFGAAGFLGGFLRKKANILNVIGVFILATLFQEIVLNIASSALFGFNIFIAFLAGIPMGLTHLVSNFSFSFLLIPAKKFIEKKGNLNEKELCDSLISRLSSISGVHRARKR